MSLLAQQLIAENKAKHALGEDASYLDLQFMQKFALAYPDFQFVKASLAQISWYHHITLLQKCKNFLTLSKEARERDLETQLMKHITHFLLE